MYGDFCSTVSLMSTSTPSTAKEFQGQEFNTVWQATLRRYDRITLPFNYTISTIINNILLVTQRQWLMHFFLQQSKVLNGLPFLVLFQRASNEYFDMVIFMTFFILVSIICFILLLKVGGYFTFQTNIFNQIWIVVTPSSTKDNIYLLVCL